MQSKESLKKAVEEMFENDAEETKPAPLVEVNGDGNYTVVHGSMVIGSLPDRKPKPRPS